MNSAHAIEVASLEKRYGVIRAVDGLSLTIARGEVFGLLGPNGAGKTTTVEILEGYREPTGGGVRVLGFDPQARIDHAYNAYDKTAVTAKAIIDLYYGKEPDKSYFTGCRRLKGSIVTLSEWKRSRSPSSSKSSFRPSSRLS